MEAFDVDRLEVLSFDCYGTLIDWERGIVAALRPVLASNGVALTDGEILEAYASLEPALQAGPFRPYREVLTGLVAALGQRFGFEPDADEERALVRSLGDWPPFTDTVQALRRLGDRYRLAVISNVDEALFARTADRLGVSFDQVVTAERVGAYKPDPRPFQVALAELGVSLERLLHVAQSLFHDIVPAGKLGIATAWVNRREGREGTGATPTVPAAAGARPDLIVPDLSALAALLLNGAGSGSGPEGRGRT